MGLKEVNFSRSIAAMGRRLRLMVDRALVRIVTDSLGRQNLQVQSLADETDPSPWASMQPQNQYAYPFLPQQERKAVSRFLLKMIGFR
ncbi:hypothetical protein ACQFN5_00560 (plasmid) [Klebsiella sp. WOUb02]|uniref:hypothetical protein n=1 Tax=Klebsiella sp. WOUb02 TaxID=3161071 RepID=UPI003CF7E1FB